VPDFIYINNLSFTYDNTIEPLFDSISFQLQKGWTGVVGANGSGKTTLLKLLARQFIPDSYQPDLPQFTYYCEQRTDDVPAELPSLLNSTEKRAFKILADLEIKSEWGEIWNDLSHGERKRIQIGVALYKESELLAIDEPSNHLDMKSKQVLFRALQSFKGIGLLVSHDRDLLDNLCSHTLFLEPPDIELRRSSYSTAANERRRENLTRKRSSQLAKKEVKSLKRKVHAKAKIDQARYSGKDGLAGKIKKRLQTQLDKSKQRQESITFKKEKITGISFNETISVRNFPLIIPGGKINLGPQKILHFPELVISYANRIGIRGNNGTGKSTVIEYILSTIGLGDDKLIYIPQEISISHSKKMIERIHDYDRDITGKIMTLISWLGSDPNHVMETLIPSPGEVRKLMLAEGIMLNPGLIIMDEPTNHMDLPSIECVENALKECSCAQLLVSHDPVFLKNIVFEYWTISDVSPNEFKISIDR
jgi:ATPase subunit of ABC transporter with duplicated ATPase domains